MTFPFGLTLASVMVASVGSACDGGHRPASQASRAGAGGSDEVYAQGGQGGEDSQPIIPYARAGAGGSDDGADKGVHALSILPADSTVVVDGSSTSLQLTAAVDGAPTTGVKWSVDDVLVGVVDASGVFRAFGDRAGVVTVTARYGSLQATTTVRVQAQLTDSKVALTADDMALLRAGGPVSADFGWLYPYEGTVFPEGLSAPLMQFSGPVADALYVRVSFSNFDYEGFYAPVGPSAEELAAGASPDPAKWPLRAMLTAQAWDSIVKSTNGREDITVSVTKLTAGQSSGPIVRHLRIANGALQGMLYYNTYNSGNGGRIMRVPLGGVAEPVMGQEGSDPATRCTVCHSVSANGKVFVAARGWSEEPVGKNSGNPFESASFNFSAEGVASVRKLDTSDGRTFAFGALTPDGQWMMMNGVPDVPLDDARVRGLSGYDPDPMDDFKVEPLFSKLIDTSSGAVVDVPSLTAQVKLALTPQFAPDGSALAFSWYDDSPGRTLAVISFDGNRSPPQVGLASAVLQSSSEVLAWPSFTPDAKALLFHAGDGYDTNRHGGGASYAQVRLLDLHGNVVSQLPALNGIGADGKPYLPYGDGGLESDASGKPLAYGTPHMNYEPNVLPVALGGYYWVFFTSRRTYGNVIAPSGALPLSDKPFGTSETSPRKKIWVAAVDIDYHGKVDPSHPAFYLPGQDLVSGNMRAFAALAPCRANGASCSSGVQCCDGFCRPKDETAANLVFECVPLPSDACAGENEACSTTADCCNVAANVCINKRCAMLTPD